MTLTPSRSIAALTTVAGLLLIAMGVLGEGGDLYRVAGLSVFALGLWATAVVPGYVAALWFFLLAVLLHAAPLPTIFSGFASTSFWLVFGGLVIGIAVRETGLGARIARAIASGLGGSYLRAISAVVLVGVAMAFLMPSSMGRIVLLTPITLALAEGLGFAEGSRGRTGLVMAMVFGTLAPAFAILPANVPNLILSGSAETLYHVPITYGFYLLLHFPVLGVVKAVVIVLALAVMYSDTPSKSAPAATLPPMSLAERKLAVVLGLSLLLWITDFLHHISPAWVSLAAAVFCVIPGIGLLDAEKIQDRLGFAVLIYIAGILGLGATIAASDLGASIGNFLIDIAGFSPEAGWRNFAAMTGFTGVLGLLTTQPGIPAVLVPLAGRVAEAMQQPVLNVIMMQVVGMTTIVLPYQVPPIVVGLQLGGVSAAHAARFCLVLFVLTLLLLLPLDYLWWHVLGYAP